MKANQLQECDVLVRRGGKPCRLEVTRVVPHRLMGADVLAIEGRDERGMTTVAFVAPCTPVQVQQVAAV